MVDRVGQNWVRQPGGSGEISLSCRFCSTGHDWSVL